jgi:hypothetical protein
MPDYYEILQVSPNAEPEVIEAAYRRLARMYHPDVNTSPDAAARMQAINEAHEVLMDPARRRRFDASRGAGTRTSGQDTRQGRAHTPPRPAASTGAATAHRRRSLLLTTGSVAGLLVGSVVFALTVLALRATDQPDTERQPRTISTLATATSEPPRTIVRTATTSAPTSAAAPTTARQTVANPYEYCALVGTFDPHQAGQRANTPYTGAAEPFGKLWWRCAAGKVLVCDPGETRGSTQACGVLRTSREPWPELVAHCREAGDQDFILGYVEGVTLHAFNWICVRGQPVIESERRYEGGVGPDGYLLRAWTEVRP